jgi:hypothetical protein
MVNIERCGHSVGLGDALCHRRVAHHGHCATGGSYAQALDDRDDALQQLQGAVEALRRIGRGTEPDLDVVARAALQRLGEADPRPSTSGGQ